MRRGLTPATGTSAPSLIVLALLGTVAIGAGPGPARWTFSEVHMGVPVRLVLYADGEQAARQAAQRAFARIAALDRALSDYRPDSELNHLNDRAGTWVPVSTDLFAVLRQASRMAELTSGAFDPTVGPFVRLWREARRGGRLPEADAVRRARALVEWRQLQFDENAGAVRLGLPGMRLDLGGIAKGFVLDEALRALAAAGLTRALIEAGGDIVAGDAPPGALGWAVEVPGAPEWMAARASRLVNAALATSGPTFQFLEVDGVRYSHVVDPATGVGLAQETVVHVIARDGATADALATAVGVTGLDCAAFLAAFPDARVVEVGGPALCR